MPHNGFIYEAWMDMMENSGHWRSIPTNPNVVRLFVSHKVEKEEADLEVMMLFVSVFV